MFGCCFVCIGDGFIGLLIGSLRLNLAILESHVSARVLDPVLLQGLTDLLTLSVCMLDHLQCLVHLIFAALQQPEHPDGALPQIHVSVGALAASRPQARSVHASGD